MTRDVDKRIDFAWRVHDALDTWTGKVDTKASIVLAIEGAVLGLIVTLASDNGPLADLTGTRHTRFIVGSVLLAAGAFLSGLAVFPQLGRWRARTAWNSGIIYFGHLRRWDPKALAKHYHETEDMLPLEQLTRQHVAMSKIAWRKHAFLQYSMGASFLGVLLVYCASR